MTTLHPNLLNLSLLLFVIEGRTKFFDELRNTNASIVDFSKKAFGEILKHRDFESATRGNLPRGLSREQQSHYIGAISVFLDRKR